MTQREICENEIKAYNLAITRLINKRASMKPFSEEMEEINIRLDDLYDKKYLMLVNMARS
jgi:hypothetical protein